MDAKQDTHEKFIERVRAYTEKATKGPWIWVDEEGIVLDDSEWEGHCDEPPSALPDGLNNSDGEEVFRLHADEDEDGVYPILGIDKPNADFITSARTDLPAALSIIEQLAKEKEHQSTMIRDLCLRGDEYRKQIETLVRERDAARELCRDAGVALSAYVPIGSDSPDLELMLKLKAEGKSQ